MKKNLTLFFVCCLTPFLHGQIYVKANATGANNGSSWANAYTSLGAALVASTNNSQIWVAAGTYKPDRDSLGNFTPSNSRNKVFRLKNGVSLYGGFVGTETLLAQRNVATNLTILSGDIGVIGTIDDNVYSILVARDLSTSTRLDGVTVTLARGFLSGSALDMVNCAMNLTVANCIFSKNIGGLDSGGAIGCDIYSGLTVNNTTFNTNSAFEYGGAIFCSGANAALCLKLTGCTFDDNSAANGGGIATALKTIALNCDFTENKVSASRVVFLGNLTPLGGNGGGIYIQNDLELTNCNLVLCSALTLEIGMNVLGGAIYQKEGSITLNGCGIAGNFLYANSTGTYGSGAGIYTQGMGDCIINGCLFYLNKAEAQAAVGGGGFYCVNKNMSFTNSIFYQNEAKNATSSRLSFGGGLVASNSSAYSTKITNCNFIENKAAESGGMNTSGNTVIKNSIFWGNASTSSLAATSAHIGNTGTGAISYSIIQSGVPSSITNAGNNSAANPLFVNINDFFGADGNWPTADDGARLQINSPAAAAGTLTGAPTVDVLGINRTGYCSIGAYQRVGVIVPVTLDIFTGKTVQSTNSLMWKTRTEINNQGFDIERSSDGVNFDKLGFVKAKGQNSTYEFMDNAPLSISYYRLRQKDIDGVETLSKTITLKQDKTVSIKIYPNPTQDYLKFDGNNEIADVSIFSINGQLIYALKNARRHTPIDVSTLKSGSYMIEIKNEYHVFKQVFVKI